MKNEIQDSPNSSSIPDDEILLDPYKAEEDNEVETVPNLEEETLPSCFKTK